MIWLLVSTLKTKKTGINIIRRRAETILTTLLKNHLFWKEVMLAGWLHIAVQTHWSLMSIHSIQQVMIPLEVIFVEDS